MNPTNDLVIKYPIFFEEYNILQNLKYNLDLTVLARS